MKNDIGKRCLSVALSGLALGGLLLSGTAPAGATGADQPCAAVLQARIKIPESLLSVGPTRNPGTEKLSGRAVYGGDLRIGDLDDDGTVDFVIARAVGGIKTCYLGAFTWTGEVLWEWGDPNRQVKSLDAKDESYHAESPIRPGPVLVVDLDGDDQTEVVALVLKTGIDRTSWWDMRDMEFVILDGRTGNIEHRASPEPLIRADATDDNGKRRRANYVHQRLLAADFRGTAGPHDFVVKIGNSVMAFDQKLEPLWTYVNQFSKYGEHACYIPAVGDIDGDGRDEVCGGNYLLDHDGAVRWEKMMARHNDSVAIVDWDGDRGNGREMVLSGFGQVVNQDGDVLVQLGPEVVPHGQEVRCGRFRTDIPGLQMAVRYDGHTPRILLADRDGEVIERFEVDHSPVNVGMETVRWSGRDDPDLLFSPTALWDGHGRKVIELPGLPPPSGKGRMGWFHGIPAELDDSGRESIVLFDPYSDEVFVFGARPLAVKPPTGYRHTPKQYNTRLMD